MSQNTVFIGVGAGVLLIILLVVMTQTGSESDPATTVTDATQPAVTAIDTPLAPDTLDAPTLDPVELTESSDDTMADMSVIDTATPVVADTDATVAVDPVVEPAVEPVIQTEPEVVDTPTPPPGVFADYQHEEMLTDGTNVLFFHADWCPSCRTLERDLVANADNFPAGVYIFKVDYDEETALRQQYGIVRQHTLVVVDQEGNEIKKLTGLTNTLDQVVSQL